jgi:hypothetical protein
MLKDIMCLIKITIPKANKNHICEGRNQLIYFVADVDHDFEKQEINRQIDFCEGIKKGENYINQTFASQRKIENWKSCKNCEKIINKFKLYPKD